MNERPTPVSVDAGFSSRGTLLAIVLAAQTPACSLFPDVSGFVGKQVGADAASPAPLTCPAASGSRAI